MVGLGPLSNEALALLRLLCVILYESVFLNGKQVSSIHCMVVAFTYYLHGQRYFFIQQNIALEWSIATYLVLDYLKMLIAAVDVVAHP